MNRRLLLLGALAVVAWGVVFAAAPAPSDPVTIRVRLAASAANERNPALAGNGAGKLLCAYEKIVDGTTQICARTMETQ